MVRTCGTCGIFTSKSASCHSGAHFFNISNSENGPTMMCFVHFDFDMCFALQRRALFRHLNFQKCSDAEKRSQCIAHAHQHSVSRLFYLFSTFLRTSIFFALFSSLTLSTSAFPSVHIVRSLTSKLPSILYDSVHILNVKSTRANLKHSKSSKALK